MHTVKLRPICCSITPNHAPAARSMALLCVLAVAMPAPVAAAQCQPHWLLSATSPGVGSAVDALCLWDPDGSGPASPVLTLGGSFTLAGNLPARYVATFEPRTRQWGLLGAGPLGDITSLIVLHDGSLVAAGNSSDARGNRITPISRWNGSQWTPLGFDIQGVVSTVAELPSHDLVAGGNLLHTALGGSLQRYLIRWNGVVWSLFSNAEFNNAVLALVVMPNGDLVAGGAFTSIGGTAVNHLARWNGTAWAPLGSGVDRTVFALNVRPDGELIAGGAFSVAGGIAAPGIARWDGTTWSGFGTGMGGDLPYVTELTVSPGDDVIAGGLFDFAGTTSASHLARWNRATNAWTAFPSGSIGEVRSLAVLPGGELAMGGDVFVGNVAPSRYFSVYDFAEACCADYDRSGQVAIHDLFGFLNAWFASDISTDLDGNGVELHDLLDFVTLWFAGCA